MQPKETPWSWQAPPLPSDLSLLNATDTSSTEIWHRQFWGIEAFSAWRSIPFPGITDLILSCQLSISPSSPAHRSFDHTLVRSAVRALRAEHPTIASRFAWPDLSSGREFTPDEGRFAYEVPRSDSGVERWISEVVFDRSDALIAVDNCLDDAIVRVRRELGMASNVPPKTAFQLYHIPSASPKGPHAIILRLGHTLFDAIGTFQLMDLFIAKLAQFVPLDSNPTPQFAWGEELSRLAGPVPDRSKVLWSPDKIAQDDIMIQKLREAIKFAQTGHGLTVPNPNAIASSTGYFFRSLPPESLNSLLASTRKHGCTIFSVLFSIEMLALLRVNPPTHTDDITTLFFPSAFNLREKYLKKNQRDKTNWEVCGALGFNILLARNLGRFVADNAHDTSNLVHDVFVLAKEINSQLEEQKEYMNRAGFWVDELINTIISMAAHAESAPPPIPIPTLSSLGVVDKHLATLHPIPSGGHVEVADPVFTVRAPYAPYSFPLIVHPYTWGGTLRISFSFPEAYMGSVEDLVAMEGRTRTRNSDASVLDMINEFMRILAIVSESGR